MIWGGRTAKKMVFDVWRIKSCDMFREGLRLGSWQLTSPLLLGSCWPPLFDVWVNLPHIIVIPFSNNPPSVYNTNTWPFHFLLSLTLVVTTSPEFFTTATTMQLWQMDKGHMLKGQELVSCRLRQSLIHHCISKTWWNRHKISRWKGG